MTTSLLLRRSLTTLAVLVGVALVSGCDDDDPTEPPGHAEPHEMRLIVGTGGSAQVITISEGGTVTGGPITIGIGTVAIAAEFLDEDDEVINDELDPSDFELFLESADDSILTAAVTSQFGGTLTGVVDGSTTIDAALFHEGHADFGEFTVPVTVTP